MGEQRIYCNVTECFFNRPLEEPHTKKGRPGFTPIGGTDKYVGMCGRSGLEMRYKVFISPTSMKQKIAYCGGFITEVDVEYSKSTDSGATWGAGLVVEPEPFICKVFDCEFNMSPDRETGSSCRKLDDGEPIYVDLIKVFDGNDTIQIPRCSSEAKRFFEGHVDWAKAASGNRGSNTTAFPVMQTRPRIIGSY